MDIEEKNRYFTQRIPLLYVPTILFFASLVIVALYYLIKDQYALNRIYAMRTGNFEGTFLVFFLIGMAGFSLFMLRFFFVSLFEKVRYIDETIEIKPLFRKVKIIPCRSIELIEMRYVSGLKKSIAFNLQYRNEDGQIKYKGLGSLKDSEKLRTILVQQMKTYVDNGQLKHCKHCKRFFNEPLEDLYCPHCRSCYP